MPGANWTATRLLPGGEAGGALACRYQNLAFPATGMKPPTENSKRRC